MRIATWNVNSVRARLLRIVPWLEEHRPDVLCMQETKVVDEMFPFEPLEDCGYNVVVHGQKSYNGVAILARHGLEDVVRGFDDGIADDHARVIGATVDGEWQVLNLYVPNGQAVGTDKYRYKLEWLARLRRFLADRYREHEKLVVCGDFNVTFDDRDVHDPEKWHEKILCSTPEREALRHVMDFGLHDALRKHHDEGGIYTWWDLRQLSFQKGWGLRIDHFLITEEALDHCTEVAVDREARKGKGPSDHAPVIADFG